MNGLPPPTGARYAASHPVVIRATNPAFLHPDRSSRNDPPLCARCRRSGARGSQASRGQSAGLRRSALRASSSGPRVGPVGVAARANARLRRETDRGRSRSVWRIRPPGRNPSRAFARTSKATASPELRSHRMARLSPGRHGRGMGHGSRRAHRPGDARPSAGEWRSASGGSRAGASRVGRASPRAKEDL